MPWISILKSSPILIPFLIGIYKYREIKKYRYLFFFVCFGVVTEIGLQVLKALEYRNNLGLGHIYFPVSFVFLCLFFQKVLNGFINKIWYKVLIVCFLLHSVVQVLFFQKLTDYPSLQAAIHALVMVAFSIVYFYKIMVEAKVQKLSKEPLVWITSAMLIYYAGNLFYDMLFNLFLESSIEYLRSLGIYFISLNTLFYILIAIGFLKAGKQKEVVR